MALSDKAMLAAVHIGMIGLTKKDSDATQIVIDQKNATKNAGNYSKNLIIKEDLKPITRIANAARAFHREMTLPWGDNGLRLLPAKKFIDYSKEMGDMEANFEMAVADFAADYDTKIENAEAELGDMFNINDYPDASELTNIFTFDRELTNIEDPNDFRVALQDGEVTKLKEEISGRINKRQAEAMKELWQRLYDVVSKLVVKLQDADNPIFRNSLIDNIISMTELLPDMNVMDDAGLSTMCNDIQAKLCTLDPVGLREKPDLKEEAIKAGKELLENMEEHIS
jgi:hypothetical protein